MHMSDLRTLLDKYITLAAKQTEERHAMTIPWNFRIRSSTIPNFEGKSLLSVAEATEAIFIDEDHFYGEVEIVIDRVDFLKNQSLVRINFGYYPLPIRDYLDGDPEKSFSVRVKRKLAIKYPD